MPEFFPNETCPNPADGSIFAAGGPIFASSEEIARRFGKKHQHVLRSIDTLRQESGPDLAPCFRAVWRHFDGPCGASMKSRAFELDRLGTVLLVFNFTGSKARRVRLRLLDPNGLLTSLSAQRSTGGTGGASS